MTLAGPETWGDSGWSGAHQGGADETGAHQGSASSWHGAASGADSASSWHGAGSGAGSATPTVKEEPSYNKA